MNTVTLLYYILFLSLLLAGTISVLLGIAYLARDQAYRDVISKHLEDIMEQVNDD